jgi:hypothetical protein
MPQCQAKETGSPGELALKKLPPCVQQELEMSDGKILWKGAAPSKNLEAVRTFTVQTKHVGGKRETSEYAILSPMRGIPRMVLAMNGDALSGQALVNGKNADPQYWPLGVFCNLNVVNDFAQADGFTAVSYHPFAGLEFKANSAEALAICTILPLMNNPTTVRVAIGKLTFMDQLYSEQNKKQVVTEHDKQAMAMLLRFLAKFDFITGCLGPHEDYKDGAVPFMPDVEVALAEAESKEVRFEETGLQDDAPSSIPHAAHICFSCVALVYM